MYKKNAENTSNDFNNTSNETTCYICTNCIKKKLVTKSYLIAPITLTS